MTGTLWPVRTGALRPVLAVGAALLAAWPILDGTPYGLRLATLAGIYTLLTLGYQLAYGQAGLLSLCQAAFFGLGGYVAALLATDLGWDGILTLPAAMLAPALLAAIAAGPVLRLGSHYVALATLAIAQILLLGAVQWQDLTGGANGLAGIPALRLFGGRITPGWPLLATVWAAAAGSLAILAWLLGGRIAAQAALLRTAPLAAAAIGVPGRRLRARLFIGSAGLAGLAGAFYAHAQRVVSPDALSFPTMVACLTMTVLGGRGRLAGAPAGALVVVLLPELLRGLEGWATPAFAALLLTAVLAAPDGIVGRLAAWLPEPPPRLPAAADWRPDCRPAALAVRGLAKRFGGVVALAGVDLDIAAGERIGLIGANGSGKTTLANLISGFEAADAGAIRLGACDLGRLPVSRRARAGVGRTFQTAALVAEQSAVDAVAMARPGAWLAARAVALAALGAVGAGDLAGRLVASLAPAERRRVEIARALALEPSLLILDEPAAGLGPDAAAELARYLVALPPTLSLLVIEHDLAFLSAVVDRLVCLDAGAVVAAGPTASVLADPQVRRGYLGVA